MATNEIVFIVSLAWAILLFGLMVYVINPTSMVEFADTGFFEVKIGFYVLIHSAAISLVLFAATGFKFLTLPNYLTVVGFLFAVGTTFFVLYRMDSDGRGYAGVNNYILSLIHTVVLGFSAVSGGIVGYQFFPFTDPVNLSLGTIIASLISTASASRITWTTVWTLSFRRPPYYITTRVFAIVFRISLILTGGLIALAFMTITSNMIAWSLGVFLFTLISAVIKGPVVRFSLNIFTKYQN